MYMSQVMTHNGIMKCVLAVQRMEAILLNKGKEKTMVETMGNTHA